jgi:alpha,alpha-trehalose phosphorylase
MAHIPYEAVLFDLDGVLTSTAALHAACWKRTFEEVLGEPFDVERDYLAHVDGKPREDGVRDFLRSRGIEPSPETVRDIGDRKQALVESALADGGVEPYPGSVRWVEYLRRAGVRTAVVSSSANCRAVLEAAGIADLFELTVDGTDVERLGLRGKPAPDGFLEAAARLRVAPRRAVVVEDALAGVAAGRAGEFGIVIGVARGVEPAELRSAGADLVVEDLEELVP